MINEKAYELAAKKLGITKVEVRRVFKEYCKICSDEYRANEEFCVNIPKLGKIFKDNSRKPKTNGEKDKHQEDTSDVHFDSDNNGCAYNKED